jgi:predicted DNA-binding protein (UPF0251 family)
MTNDRISTRPSRKPRKAGRPKRELTVAELPVIDLVRAGEITVAEAARTLGVHRGTVGRSCKAVGIDPRKARADYVRRMIAEVAARTGRRLSS